VGGCEEQVGIGLGAFDEISRDDGYVLRELEELERRAADSR
jgi:hypothetical protein